MWFQEDEVVGTVVLEPFREELQPRNQDRGGRNVPVMNFRFEADDGRVFHVSYAGELDGQISQGDMLVVQGFFRGPGVLRATSIWLRGRLDAAGRLQPVNPPVRVANKCVCAVATCLFGRDSVEVALCLRVRDEWLARHAAGRRLIAAYYAVSPWLVVNVLEDRPALRRFFRGCLKRALNVVALGYGRAKGGKERVSP